MAYLNVNKRKIQLIACTNWRILALRIWLCFQKHFCAEVEWLTQIRSLDQTQTCLQLHNDIHCNSLLKKYGNTGRWCKCCCVLSAGGSGLLPTANSHSKYGCCSGGLTSCCYIFCPSRVHPTGVLLQTIYASEVKVSKDDWNTTITPLFSIQICTGFSGYLQLESNLEYKRFPPLYCLINMIYLHLFPRRQFYSRCNSMREM